MKEEMTYHVAVNRAERVNNIVNNIGIGQVIKEKYVRFSLDQAGRWVCLTDTGVTIIKDEQKLKVITMYVTTQRELVAVYGGAKKVPHSSRKRQTTTKACISIKRGKRYGNDYCKWFHSSDHDGRTGSLDTEGVAVMPLLSILDV